MPYGKAKITKHKLECGGVATMMQTVPAPTDSRSSTGYANQAAGGKTPTAEEWWIKTAAILCQKADQSGVIDFRITKVEGKWVFEITPEEQPDSHTDGSSPTPGRQPEVTTGD